MRDPQRIDGILEILESLWKAVPDQRFTQLVINAAKTGEACPVLFNMEDEEFKSRLTVLAHQVLVEREQESRR